MTIVSHADPKKSKKVSRALPQFPLDLIWLQLPESAVINFASTHLRWLRGRYNN